MSELVLALLGFATIIAIIVLLLRNVTVPSLAFIGVSTVTTLLLILTGTFTPDEMGGFIKAGVADVHGTAALFIFSVLYFGIMSDVGMFDRIINALMKRVGSNVVGVCLMTCVIAMISHLDGGGASTFLITIPAMLPVYKRLKMRPTTLLFICVTAMGVMNLLPWGGPTMRSASVLGMEANLLWRELLPMQGVGILIAVFTAVFWGFVEKKRIDSGNGYVDNGAAAETEEAAADSALARPQFFAFNVVLTLAVILSLVFLPVPAYYVFMVGCVMALLVNYRGAKLQNKVIKSHSGPAKACARSRTHSVAELQAAANALLTEAVDEEDAETAARLATQALLYEVCTTPKPGLVDRANNGSHRDMDIFTFMGSSAALWPYFARCAAIGRKTASQPAPQTFAALRSAGRQAEAAMLHATGGVNTHKGAVFTMGALCAALGRLDREQWGDAARILSEVSAMAAGIVERELVGLTEETARTTGQKLYVAYGITGVRGQLEEGLPAGLHHGLPRLRQGLRDGVSADRAGAAALLAILANTTDTNLIARSDRATQQSAACGGTDVLAMMMKKYTQIKDTGIALLLCDLVMVVAACFVFDI